METKQENPVHGLLAEFEQPDDLIHAAAKAHEAGYRKMDAYTPFPVHGLTEALGIPRTRLPVLVFMGGCCGAIVGFMLQYWTMSIDYPLNIGGRPANSIPSWVVITFECTILFAALTTVLGMIGLNRLPQPYHPVFNVPAFTKASKGGFFLCIESNDPNYDEVKTAEFLRSQHSASVAVVPNGYTPDFVGSDITTERAH